MTLLMFENKVREMNWRLSVFGQEVIDGTSDVGRTVGDQYISWMESPTSKYL